MKSSNTFIYKPVSKNFRGEGSLMKSSNTFIYLGLALILIGFFVPPSLEIEGKATTGVSVGVTPQSGMAPLKIKINAILWELRDNAWYTLSDKLLVFCVNGEEVGYEYSLKGQVASLYYTLQEAGTYNIQVRFEGDEQYAPSTSDIATVTVTGPYVLTILATEGGTTEPAPGSYEYREVKEVAIYAKREPGYDFQYWELDGQKIVQSPTVPLIVKMDRSHTVKAVFKEEEPEHTLSYTLTVDKSEVPDVADWRYPVIHESEMVTFTVTTPPDLPITQPVQLEVLKDGVWQLVEKFVVVDGEATVIVAPGLYGEQGDTLTFRVYDKTFEVESNHVTITLLEQAPEPPPEEPEEEPTVTVPDGMQDTPPDETVDYPTIGMDFSTWFTTRNVLMMFGFVLAGYGLYRKHV